MCKKLTNGNIKLNKIKFILQDGESFIFHVSIIVFPFLRELITNFLQSRERKKHFFYFNFTFQ